MRILICFAILMASVASLVDAASVSDITLRISTEQKFITDAMENHKSQLDAHISTTRTNLNTLADTLKEKQREAGKPCSTFIRVIESIQKAQINSAFYFPSCRLGAFSLVRVEGVRDSLTVLLKTAENIGAACGKFPSSICQNQINSVDRNLDLVHKTVVADVGLIEKGTKECLEEKTDIVKRALVGHESIWSKCVENNKKWMDN